MSHIHHDQQAVQEDQYSLPYHYIPDFSNGRFTQHLYWSWGFRYLGGIRVVLDQLKKGEFNNLLDVGCGDGRFLRELNREYPGKTALGIDYSDRAIALAKSLNPGLSYKVADLTNHDLDLKFDVVTMVEVLEHIHTDHVDVFLERAAALLNEGGRIVLTVPHLNKPVSSKHFQHFDSKKLRQILAPHFREMQFYPFDARSKLLRFLEKTMKKLEAYFVLTNSALLGWAFQKYIRRYLYTQDENKCMRIGVVAFK